MGGCLGDPLLKALGGILREERAMKLTSSQVQRALSQFEAEAIPDDHPLARKLNDLFGEHTFFLNSNGLNIVEPEESAKVSAHAGTVVNVSDWNDSELTGLVPHTPVRTEIVILLETKH
jgi:hypothetical protein